MTTIVETVCECENNCANRNECKNKNENENKNNENKNKYTDIPNNHVNGGCFQEVYTYTIRTFQTTVKMGDASRKMCIRTFQPTISMGSASKEEEI